MVRRSRAAIYRVWPRVLSNQHASHGAAARL
jgi:hypothetical protein